MNLESTDFKSLLSPEQKRKLADIYQDYDKFKKDMALDFAPPSNSAANVYFEDIFELAENVDIRVPFKVSSHRRLLGPVIILGKKFLMRLVRPIISVCFKRQLIVNDHVLNLAQRLAVLEDRVKKLEAGLEHHRHA